MEKITDHVVTADDAKVTITVMDEKGAGGAYPHYRVSGADIHLNRSYKDIGEPPRDIDVYFQNGPIQESGINGLTQEVLIAICIHRLQSFQAGNFACRENEKALTHLEEALHWLQQRPIRRVRRGVEGTENV